VWIWGVLYAKHLVVNWAIIIGTPTAYIAISVYMGRRISGTLGAAVAVLLIGIPVVWIGVMYATLSSACTDKMQTYLQREEGVDGVFAKGALERIALNADIRSEDGYLFYEFEDGDKLYRVDPSGKREQVQRRRSRFEFEVFEPQVRNALLNISESRYEVRVAESGTLVAEGADVLLGGFPLRRLHRMLYRNEYIGCGAGVRRGGWRQGKMSVAAGRKNAAALTESLDSQNFYSKRDREFLRTALIPSRSVASVQSTLDVTAPLESTMSFSNTLWKLVSEIHASGRYGAPGLFFRDDVPARQLRSARAAQVRDSARGHGGDKTEQGDPYVVGLGYWVDVLYSPKYFHRDVEVPRIRVIQKQDSVIVKAVPLRNEDEVFDTESLDYRRGLVDDMNRFTRLAVQAPEQQRAPSLLEISSPYGYEETIERILQGLEASPEHIVRNVRDIDPRYSHLHSGRPATRIQFSRKDGNLMSQAFSFDSHTQDYASFGLDVIDRNGTIVVDCTSLAKALPEGLLADFVAAYAAGAMDVIQVALEPT
jgi:hypothetical protein